MAQAVVVRPTQWSTSVGYRVAVGVLEVSGLFTAVRFEAAGRCSFAASFSAQLKQEWAVQRHV